MSPLAVLLAFLRQTKNMGIVFVLERLMAATEPALSRSCSDGHLSFTWCCWQGGMSRSVNTSGPSDNSGRVMVSRPCSSLSGDPDTPWYAAVLGSSFTFSISGCFSNVASDRSSEVLFMTVGDADTILGCVSSSVPSLSGFLGAFDRSGATFDRSHDNQRGDVRIGGPHEQGLLFSPRLLLVHNVVRPGMSSLGAGR